MKLSIDFGGDASDERSKLLARAYVAAVVGPLRRPNGRPIQTNVQVAQFAALAKNNTTEQVLFVAVAIVTANAQPLEFSTSNSQGTQSRQLAPPFNFILYPGETLAVAATTGSCVVAAVTETF